MLKYSIVFYSLFFFTGAFGRGIKSDDSLKAFTADTSKYIVVPVNVNSAHSDFSPIILNNQLIFVSGRETGFGVSYTNDNNEELLDIFISDKKDSLNFADPHSFSGMINSHYNDGPLTINSEGTKLIFTSNAKGKANRTSTGEKELQLLSSEKKNNNWTRPQTLPFCKPDASYCHPALSADQLTLIFSSNMAGGYGGMDLYYSRFENNTWSTPVNCGAAINSTANEVFPFLSEDGLLYFSSDDKTGYGGLDLYSFNMKDATNSKRHLLETPLNSAFDDFGIFTDATGNKGYLSSNRNGTNKDDIFYFLNKYPYFNNCTPFVKPSYCYTFFEESTLTADDTLGLTYQWNLGDGTKVKGIEAKHCFSKPGNYLVELNIIEKTSGALFYNEASYEFAVEDSQQVYINAPDTIPANTALQINAFQSKLPGFSISNYYWNFGDGNYSSGEAGTHAYQKEGVYTISLAVTAKNDSSGISRNTCVEKKILVSKTGSGYSAVKYNDPNYAKTLHSSKNIDSLNFRVFLGSSGTNISTNSEVFDSVTNVREFKTNSSYGYTSGKTNTITAIVPDYNKARSNGFKEASVIGFSGDSLLPNQENSMKGKINASLKEVLTYDLDTNVYKRNIHFDFNKFSVNKTYFQTLDSIFYLLKQNQKYTLSLYSFTDSIGNDNYNMKLSLKRASEIRNYFIRKGISGKRIKFAPMGEELPFTENSSSIDIGYNRRVLIYLLKK